MAETERSKPRYLFDFSADIPPDAHCWYCGGDHPDMAVFRNGEPFGYAHDRCIAGAIEQAYGRGEASLEGGE